MSSMESNGVKERRWSSQDTQIYKVISWFASCRKSNTLKIINWAKFKWLSVSLTEKNDEKNRANRIDQQESLEYLI